MIKFILKWFYGFNELMWEMQRNNYKQKLENKAKEEIEIEKIKTQILNKESQNE